MLVKWVGSCPVPTGPDRKLNVRGSSLTTAKFSISCEKTKMPDFSTLSQLYVTSIYSTSASAKVGKGGDQFSGVAVAVGKPVESGENGRKWWSWSRVGKLVERGETASAVLP